MNQEEETRICVNMNKAGNMKINTKERKKLKLKQKKKERKYKTLKSINTHVLQKQIKREFKGGVKENLSDLLLLIRIQTPIPHSFLPTVSRRDVDFL